MRSKADLRKVGAGFRRSAKITFIARLLEACFRHTARAIQNAHRCKLLSRYNIKC